jgi:hypothetical protein
MQTKLGDVLVRMGMLSASQRDEVLACQASSGRPFGALAEELFGVSPRAIERAWASQYAELVGRVDLGAERTEPGALELIDRRQAWQFQVLPVRFEGGDLVLATTEAALPRAMRFAGWALGVPVSFVLAEPAALEAGLQASYPLSGGPEALRRRSA